jgi:hypothetical protein
VKKMTILERLRQRRRRRRQEREAEEAAARELQRAEDAPEPMPSESYMSQTRD